MRLPAPERYPLQQVRMEPPVLVSAAMILPACYAMPGTDAAYAATRLCSTSPPDPEAIALVLDNSVRALLPAYAFATRCPAFLKVGQSEEFFEVRAPVTLLYAARLVCVLANLYGGDSKTPVLTYAYGSTGFWRRAGFRATASLHRFVPALLPAYACPTRYPVLT
eukprot:3452655-Rhodomonas_salina.2